MRLPVTFALATLALLVHVSSAIAGIAVELYPNERPVEADVVIPRFLEELEKTGTFVAVPSSVRGELGVRTPAPGIRDRNLTAQELLAEINIGLKAQYDLRYDQAIVQFVAAIEKGHANPALLVASSKYRDAMLDAMVGLATAYHRRNRGDDRLRSKEVMQEVIRSFPDRLATMRQTYGPEPDTLYKAALKSLQARGTGSLVVNVDDPNALIFVNEGDQPRNATFRANLPAGRYRILVKHPTSNGRRFDITVEPNETAKLAVDWAVASTLISTDRWIGFVGITAETALRYLHQLAGQRHAAFVLVTVQSYKGEPAVKATLYRASDRTIVRSYLVTLDGAAEAKATALALALVKGQVASGAQVIDASPHANVVDDDDPTPQQPAPTDATRGRTNRWFIAAAVTGAATLLGGGLAIKFAVDGRAAGDELDRVCAVMCSSMQANSLIAKRDGANRNALLSGAFAGVTLAASVVFIVVGKGQDTSPAVAVLPTRGGFATSYAVRF